MIIDLIPRTLIGGVLVGLAATRAYRRNQLTFGGAYAAFALGTAAVAGGIGWAVALAAFFYSSMLAGSWRASDKRARTYSVLPDVRTRDAWQVLANGGLFAVAAISWGVGGSWEAGFFGFGALATATADTWATEIGIALDATPRSIINWRHVAPGTSGGVSAFGLSAAVAGSFLIAVLAIAAFTTPYDIPRLEVVFVGGFAGALADSLLGGTVQSRRWCEPCGAWTERRVHTCGFRSHHRTGFRWMTNDVVNLLATAVGGAVAASMGRM